jgi:hypothetical protein
MAHGLAVSHKPEQSLEKTSHEQGGETRSMSDSMTVGIDIAKDSLDVALGVGGAVEH